MGRYTENADIYGFTIDFIVFIVQGLSKSKCYTKALDYKVGFILIVFLCDGFKIKSIYEFNLNYYVSPPLGETYCFALSVCPSATLRFRSITQVPFDAEPLNFIG